MEEHTRAGEGTGVAVNVMISKRDTFRGPRVEVRTEIVRLVNGRVHDSASSRGNDHVTGNILTTSTDA